MSKASERPLTWQEVLIVSLCPLFSLPIFMLVEGARESRSLLAAGAIFAGCLLTLIACLGWADYRRLTRHDVMPDVLIQKRAKNSIYDVGAAHFVISVEQLGGAVRFTCEVQNCYHAETTFLLSLLPFENFHMLAAQPPPLAFILLASQVVRASIILPLRDPSLNGPQARWQISASAKAKRGRRIRFGRRTAVTTRIPPAFTAALLLTGHYMHSGGGTFITLNPLPVETDIDSDAVTPPGEATWTIVPTWKPSFAMEAELHQRL